MQTPTVVCLPLLCLTDLSWQAWGLSEPLFCDLLSGTFPGWSNRVEGLVIDPGDCFL